MCSDDDLLPVFIPALVALLISAEEMNGVPLSRNQVQAVRDNANCVMLPPSAKAGIEKERGYADIDPERCWEDWLVARQDVVRVKHDPEKAGIRRRVITL